MSVSTDPEIFSPSLAEINSGCQAELPPMAIRGLELFNGGEYFEAHEALETAWRAETRPIRELYRGILQVGVAYYHIQRGNGRGALKMLQRCRRWLAPFPDSCCGIDLATFRQDFLQVQQQLELAAENPAVISEIVFKPIHFR